MIYRNYSEKITFEIFSILVFTCIPEIDLRRFSFRFSLEVIFISNPWENREISKHLNWELFKKHPIKLESFPMSQSSLLEWMQKFMSFQAICILSPNIWFEKRYLQYTQWVPMGNHGFPNFWWVTHANLCLSHNKIQYSLNLSARTVERIPYQIEEEICFVRKTFLSTQFTL